MTPIVVIPARMASTRLPGKPLADIGGRSMIMRVWDVGVQADLGPVIIAAGDREIVEAVEAHGGRAVMTDPALPSGSDRVRAALQEVDPQGRYDMVINLQGDMPTLDPEDLRLIQTVFAEAPQADIATLMTPTNDPDETANPNVVKAIPALRADACAHPVLYFTRASAPSGEGPVHHHVGVYGFRRNALERFTSLPPSPLERRERLEQLRALENGMTIFAGLISHSPLGVDSPADLERARAHFAAKA